MRLAPLRKLIDAMGGRRQRLLGLACFSTAGALLGTFVCIATNWWAELPFDGCIALACASIGAALGTALVFVKKALADEPPSVAAAAGLIPSGAFFYLVSRLKLWTGEPLLYKGLESLPNWYLYPVWFVVLGLTARLTWRPFVDAWLQMPGQALLVKSPIRKALDEVGAGGAKKEDNPIEAWHRSVLDPEDRNLVHRELTGFLRRWRPRVLVCSLAVAAAIAWFDNRSQWAGYAEPGSPDTAVCVVGGPAKIWAAGARTNRGRGSEAGGKGQAICAEKGTSCPCRGKTCKNVWTPGLDCDFSVAYRVTSAHDVTAARQKKLFSVMCVLEGFAFTLAVGTFLQLLFHVIAFWWYSISDFVCGSGLRCRIRMNPYSPSNEFGLECWNHALNNVYWVFSPALLIALLSKATLDNPEQYTGQQLMRLLIPVAIALPMVLSILARQTLLKAVRVDVSTELRPPASVDSERLEVLAFFIERMHAQRIWPLTENWASKAGIALAFTLLSLFLGVEAFRALL